MTEDQPKPQPQGGPEPLGPLLDATLAPEAQRARSYRLASEGFLCEAVADPWNRRLKLLGIDAKRYDHFDERMRQLIAHVDDRTFTKLTVYARADEDAFWEGRGFRREGDIRGFFADGTDTHLWAFYTDDARAGNPLEEEQDRIVELARSKEPADPPLPEGCTLRVAGPDDAPKLGAFLRPMFPDYPTPLTDETIADNLISGRSRFHVVEEDGRIVACASAEVDEVRANAEITDCATDPEARGRGLMVHVIRSFERMLPAEKGIRDLFTIARADEVGMNCAFAKAGYEYTGRLVHNCRMPGGWESMNVWCRRAAEPGSDGDT